MIDGTIVKAHQHAAGARGGQVNQALGRSCGGFSSKIHAKVDALGLPLKFIVTGGQVHDSQKAKDLIDNELCDCLIADRGYDDDSFREKLISNGIEPVIPGRKSRGKVVNFDNYIYKERNIIERFFNRIKHFRRIATRYDKTVAMFVGSLLLISILLWIKL